MSDPIQRTSSGADDPSRKRQWFAQRSNRREYWIYVGIVIAVMAVLQLLGFNEGQTGGSAVILLIQIRRFHDLGRSGWWAVVLMVAEVVVTLVAMFTLGQDAGLLVAVLANLAAIIVMGVLPGQPFENKWGPPPGRKSLAQTFS